MIQITQPFKKCSIVDNVGTSLTGYLRTTYEELVETFGEPSGRSDDGKTTCEWIFRFGGHIVTIYDYKERSTPMAVYDWHVGSHASLKTIVRYLPQITSTLGEGEEITIMTMDDPYRVLPHRDVLDCTMYSTATGEPIGKYDYEHVPCGMPLSRGDVVDANWCPHCAATVNKAAALRGRKEWAS